MRRLIAWRSRFDSWREPPHFAFQIFVYLPDVPTPSDKLESLPALNQVVVPDLGQSSLDQIAFGRVDESRLFEINF